MWHIVNGMMETLTLELHVVTLAIVSLEYGWMKPYNPTICTCQIWSVKCNYNSFTTCLRQLG